MKMNGMYIPEIGTVYTPDPNDPLITGIYPKEFKNNNVINSATAKKLQSQYLNEDMAWKTKDIIKKGNEAINKALRSNESFIEVNTLGYNSEEIKSYFEDLGYKLTRTDKRNDYPRYKIEW